LQRDGTLAYRRSDFPCLLGVDAVEKGLVIFGEA